jgi:DNA repair photolyase
MNRLPGVRESVRGRGAATNPPGRFERLRPEAVEDGWGSMDAPLPPLATQVQAEFARHLITRNESPDVPFEQSINPYRGCEHGCVYCYARPSHAYVDLSPGLDFETRLFYKADAARLVEAELAAPGYRCRPITLGANTDPYQPIERERRVTRDVLEVLSRTHHPLSIITESALIERDVDLLTDLAARRLVHVFVSVTTLDDALKRVLEPRTASPAARLRTIRGLTRAGIPVGVLLAPVIPARNDHELESIVNACADAGALTMGYVMLRLPHELEELFTDWVHTHYPDRAAKVLSLVRQMRGGWMNDPRYGTRMRGGGAVARLIAERFALACRRHGVDGDRLPPLVTQRFRPPERGGQMSLGV